jgi:tetratricopeptide (TPR) repeat protein
MLKKTLFIILLLAATTAAHAQSPPADSVYNRYLDFNLARFQGETDKVMQIGESLIPDAYKLPEKARINFYNSVGKMYEDDGQYDKAITYYEKVSAAVPDYYVAQRALGYLYLRKAKDLQDKLNGSAGNPDLNKQLTADYNAAVRKALPHLEKAQACDPSDETLQIIKTAYRNIKDEQGLQTLDSRLKELAKSCIDLLNDQ